ncbi:hypothetical protein ORJ00_02220 [Rheinheimera baltica]|uniref:carboxylate--amine ligase n=1 Tax=Rheinheimera baltica TaxID=67576 RepID=UPI00273F58E0|nr:hypothetical protein [Rheinheimera baltica]MDP5141555.1 hypothetical protein [Rheinheimera baltica]
MTPSVVVLSAGPNGLGVTRSLYLKGIKPWVISTSSLDVINYSRLPERKTVLDANSEASLLAVLSDVAFGTIVIPTSDWFVSFLSEHTSQLKPRLLYLEAPAQITEMLIDKAWETQFIASYCALPKTVQVLQDASSLLACLTLPIIIKPRSHKHMVLGSKNRILTSVTQVKTFFSQYKLQLQHLIAQEIVPGDDSCQWVCNCFFDQNNELVQAFTFNRLRLSPSHFGVTSYARSQQNEEVVQLCRTIGKALGYVGPAMLEFKRDPRDGEYYYIELNPRLGMCNYFDTYCGINNAFASYQLLQGETLPVNPKMQSNVIFVSLYEDFFSRRKDGESVMEILRDYCRNARQKHVFIYFVWWDPLPAMYMLLQQVKQMGKALLSRLKQ